jgi:hypothetical protein
MMRKYLAITLLAFMGLGLTGCSNPVKSVTQTERYNWQQYGNSVEQYLDSKDYVAQVEAMEQNLAYCLEANQSVPPGFHLHLGMLYGQLGYATRMLSEFALEKALYPESRHLVDFILGLNRTAGGKR